MDERDFGSSGLKTSILGFGAGHIGGGELDDAAAERIVHAAIDHGVTLFDTARSYGSSEERLGRAIRSSSSTRDRLVISTKGGYGIDGVADWTGEVITRGIDEALGRLQTDHLDIFHLHSCGLEALGRDDIFHALEDARTKGKVRVAAYSGENEELGRAIESGRFGSVQLSINVCDRNALRDRVPEASRRGLGVIGKRPLANAPWRHATRPHGEYVETYWTRFREMGLERWDGDWSARALRFAAFAPGVTSVIVGTRSVDHLRTSVEAVGHGPLSDDESIALAKAWDAHGAGWRGEI